AGDGVASIKHRRDLSTDGIRNLATALGRGRLKEDLESSTWPRRSITTWEDLTTRFLAQFFPSGRIAKLRNDILMFQQHQGESLSEAWTLVPTTLSIAWKIPNKPLLNMHPRVLDEAGGKWYTFKPEQNNLGDTYNPSWKSHLNLSSINAITICLKQPNEPQNNELEREDREERSNPENIDTTLPAPHDPSISFITEKVHKLNSFLESSGWVPQSSDTEIVCTKEDDGEVMFIDIIRKNDDSLEEGPEDEGSATIEELEVEYFDTFPTRSELAYHMYLMRGLIPSLFLRNPIITEGCPSNLKIPCYIGHVHVEKAYIDLNCPLNVMTRMLYHWSMRRNSTLGKILIDE
ncbi:MAK10-like protein, partial [Tanacetum coccineum]